jgi:hypothetical protein
MFLEYVVVSIIDGIFDVAKKVNFDVCLSLINSRAPIGQWLRSKESPACKTVIQETTAKDFMV